MWSVISVLVIGCLAWGAFFFSIDFVVGIFPSLAPMFADNTIAYGLFLFSLFVRLPFVFCALIALILGALFADVWYYTFLQYCALEIFFLIFSLVSFLVIGGTYAVGDSLYSRFKCFLPMEAISNLMEKIKCITWFKGRIGRKQFVIRGLVSLVGSAIGYIIIMESHTFMGIIGAIILVISSVLWFSTIVKRLHDIGSSGWWCLLLMVLQSPTLQKYVIVLLAYIIAVLILTFLKGEEGENRYGEKPC